MPPSPIQLLPLDKDLANTLSAGRLDSLAAVATEEIMPLLASIASAYVSLYDKTGAEKPWIGYLTLDEGTGSIIGSCGFKDRPSSGRCEMAYFTFPAYERRGYGKAMAARLVEIAFSDGELQGVLAHTLPETNASARILASLGFTNLGPVEDPEDGTVWRWQLAR